MTTSDLFQKIRSVLVVDFGGQYTHLVARRIRELGTHAIIVPYSTLPSLSPSQYPAIVYSGSYKSVNSIEPWVFEQTLKIIFQNRTPILGICFGHQLIAKMLGARVKSGCGEYGRTKVRVIEHDDIFNGWEKEETVWMSHSECVEEGPQSARVLAISENGYIAAFRADVNGVPVFGVQFHPEVSHTSKGLQLIDNFLRIANVPRTWIPKNYYAYVVEEAAKELSRSKNRVVAAVSGGVDSTVAALIAKKVVGDRLIPVFVDHGLFREGEPEEVVELLKQVGLEPMYIDAKERFLRKLEGVVDCELRRQIIGEEFARVFDEVMVELKADAFVQGTTYPDIVESGLHLSDKIKTHHNVAGLPSWFRERYIVVEPVKYLYKDEVRTIGKMIGLPDSILHRHPFPGPGLATRIIGVFTREKLEICRKASKIVEEIMRKHGFYNNIWQAFAVVGDDKWVGVKGDSRVHGYVVTVRIVESQDAMTADYAKIPYDVLEEISKLITSSIENVTMVTYAITTKPPSTIEPC